MPPKPLTEPVKQAIQKALDLTAPLDIKFNPDLQVYEVRGACGAGSWVLSSIEDRLPDYQKACSILRTPLFPGGRLFEVEGQAPAVSLARSTSGTLAEDIDRRRRSTSVVQNWSWVATTLLEDLVGQIVALQAHGIYGPDLRPETIVQYPDSTGNPRWRITRLAPALSRRSSGGGFDLPPAPEFLAGSLPDLRSDVHDIGQFALGLLRALSYEGAGLPAEGWCTRRFRESVGRELARWVEPEPKSRPRTMAELPARVRTTLRYLREATAGNTDPLADHIIKTRKNHPAVGFGKARLDKDEYIEAIASVFQGFHFEPERFKDDSHYLAAFLRYLSVTLENRRIDKHRRKSTQAEVSPIDVDSLPGSGVRTDEDDPERLLETIYRLGETGALSALEIKILELRFHGLTRKLPRQVDSSKVYSRRL